MQRQFRLVISLFFLLFSINILLFVFRNNGFEYVKFASKSELYPGKNDSTFLKKWDYERRKFSQAEFATGRKILRDSIGLDTISNDSEKVERIAAWLFRKFSTQLGRPHDTLNRMNAIQQYYFLDQNREQELWCGQFQRMVGFFSMSAGFVNRYVELVPRKSMPVDFH